MISPPYLKPGDKIGIVTCAGKIEKGSLTDAEKIFSGWGLKVVYGRHVYDEWNQFGGTDDQRAADFQDMVDNPEIRAVFCSRGGYGTVRIIDKIDFRLFRLYPKWVIGYSDITVLHSHINKLHGIETLHAPMPSELFSLKKKRITEKSLNLLKKGLFGSVMAYCHENNPFSRKGEVTGVLTGGNLSVIYSLLGSSSFPDMDGKILFLEEVGEKKYHIDRMLVGLQRCGLLKDIKGLVAGSMTGIKDNSDPFGKHVEEIILDAVEEYNYPVSFGFPSGHGPDNFPLFLGREVTLCVGENRSCLTFK